MGEYHHITFSHSILLLLLQLLEIAHVIVYRKIVACAIVIELSERIRLCCRTHSLMMMQPESRALVER